jgi:pilus assembly protein CpaD
MSRSATLKIIDRLPQARKLRWMLMAFSSALLAGCGGTVDRIVPTSVPMEDYHNRHPILLAETAHTLDIFPSPKAVGLDHRTASQVRDFARDYRQNGHGPITVLVPAIGGAYGRGELAEIRRGLAAAGIEAPLQVVSYPIVNPALASPIRLRFVGLKAKVADKCGDWPNDLASGSSVEGWENKPYWNLGCATQSALAAQVADSRDLVTPAGDDPADTIMRSRAIAAMRKGTDPVTDWKTKNVSISSVGY